jgi:ABC-type multidrug transport system permease subunit
MLGGLAAALAKDLRLLARDRTGLVFLTIAPIVVITVAGLSLATLYGDAPRGSAAPILVVVDEDGGWAGHAVRERLGEESSVRLREAPTREAARALVDRKIAGAALVVESGTSEALASGRDARLVLLIDPVRTVDVAAARAVAQEVRHGIERGAVDRAQSELDTARAEAERARSAVERAADDLQARLKALRERLEAEHDESARRAAAEERAVRDVVARTAADRTAAARARLVEALAPLRAFLGELAARRDAFADWLATARKQAGRYADRLPPPPEPPAVPPEVAALAREDAATLAARLVPGDGAGITLPSPSRFEAPPLPELPALDLPPLPAPAGDRLPGALEIVETSASGGPLRFNTFEQNVPGFGVTFLLLGVLLGVSLGLLDERDWGTLERVRATPTPLAALVVAKLAARFVVGVAQMALLFGFGWLVFGVSLGPEPWALVLPTAGIVFAGTAFGLVVAGVTASREAVLPLGAIAILTMAAVGGCWWPIDLEPEWMRRAALAFPTTWAMEAYNDLMIRRRTIAAAVPATGVLLAYGVVYLAAGLALIRRRVVRQGG